MSVSHEAARRNRDNANSKALRARLKYTEGTITREALQSILDELEQAETALLELSTAP